MELQQELGSGESLLWQGQPELRVIFHPSDWAAIPFSLMWGGFAVFWEITASGIVSSTKAAHPAPGFFLLWGIPFVVIGQYMIWGRFFYAAWQKTRTHYAVTNKRVLVVYSGSTRKVMNASLQTLDSTALTTRADGLGTIEFSPLTTMNPSIFSSRSRRGNIALNIDLARLAFVDIADARSVYQLIQQERDRLQTPAADADRA
jgi:hypothetical protein